METELLRLEMIEAFKLYSEKFGDFREREWDQYLKLREAYLKSIAGTSSYTPLKHTVVPLEH